MASTDFCLGLWATQGLGSCPTANANVQIRACKVSEIIAFDLITESWGSGLQSRDIRERTHPKSTSKPGILPAPAKSGSSNYWKEATRLGPVRILS